MANISDAPRFNNPALAAFAQKMAQARAVNVPQTPVATQTPKSAPVVEKENITTTAINNDVAINTVEEAPKKPEGAFVRKGMFLDIRV